MIDEKTFWNRAAPKYVRSPIRDMASYETGLEHVSRHLNSKMRVLELGCGSGMTARKLAPEVASVKATDVSSVMIEMARQSDGPVPENVTYLQAAADAPLAGEEPYDAVLAFNLLHLIPDQEVSLRAIRAMVRPGGLFISKTPCLGGRSLWLWPIIRVLQAFGMAPAVRFDTMGRLEAAIAEAGFAIVDTGTYPLKPPSRLIIARRD
jgi:2-polyprenyl-3-methyl-5-hydroxy-6-metoxy-1,4-benzoquinol methylase